MSARLRVPGLGRLARAWGVQTSYRDYRGRRRTASPDALLATLRAVGAPVSEPRDVADAVRACDDPTFKPPIDPVVVAWEGHLDSVLVRSASPPRDCRIHLEDGAIGRPAPLRTRRVQHGIELLLDVKLPIGYHHLEVELAGTTATVHILAAPRRAPAAARSWGVFLPLYAFRSKDSDCTGDYGDLARVLDWTSSLGGRFVGTLPLLPVFLDPPAEPSPYAPVSRLFWNELFVDLRSGPEAQEVRERRPWQKQLRGCLAGDYIDYESAARVKRMQLEAEAHAFFGANGPDEPAFRAWLDERPEVVEYAAFRSAAEHQGRDWRKWQTPVRADVAALDDAGRYHIYAQWLAEEQLTAAAAGRAGLYLDMPLGVHSDGYDVWRTPHLFAGEASAGAPPDLLFRGGQDWGFQPMRPDAARAQGHVYWRASLRHHLRHAAVLRLDHAMSLERLYWIPRGFPATEGVYVRYPTDELIAVLTIEAQRAAAAIVGEDLGTVSRELRRTMSRHGLHRMYVFQFETDAAAEQPLKPQPSASMASLGTHDLPTFAAFWKGLDLDVLRELGLVTEEELDATRCDRRALRAAIGRALGLHGGDDGPSAHDVVVPLLLRMAAGPAHMVVVDLEHLWHEERPHNVPGTGSERPNWRRRATRSLDDVFDASDLRRVLHAIARTREE